MRRFCLSRTKRGKRRVQVKRARLPMDGDTCKEAYEDLYSVAGGEYFYRLMYVMPMLCSFALGRRFVRLRYIIVPSTIEETFKKGKMRAI